MGVEPVTAILIVVVHFPGFSDHVPMPRSHVTRIGSRDSHYRFTRPFRPVTCGSQKARQVPGTHETRVQLSVPPWLANH